MLIQNLNFLKLRDQFSRLNNNSLNMTLFMKNNQFFFFLSQTFLIEYEKNLFLCLVLLIIVVRHPNLILHMWNFHVRRRQINRVSPDKIEKLACHVFEIKFWYKKYATFIFYSEFCNSKRLRAILNKSASFQIQSKDSIFSITEKRSLFILSFAHYIYGEDCSWPTSYLEYIGFTQFLM